jgi:hypothetical protein
MDDRVAALICWYRASLSIVMSGEGIDSALCPLIPTMSSVRGSGFGSRKSMQG